MPQQLLNFLHEVGISGVIDIVTMSILIYIALIGFKRTRAGVVFKGMVIIAIFYLIAHQFKLIMISAVLEKFFAGIAIMLIVIFQEELRRFFENIAIWSTNPRAFRLKPRLAGGDHVGIITRVATEFAKNRIGALIVLRGRDLLDRHLESGIALNGELSEAVLESIFDPHSSGHDGAVVVANDKIERFACHLPLSHNVTQLKSYGTRHAAALGISELSDSLAIVVSEEKGTLSVAHRGDLRRIDRPEELEKIISRFYTELHPSQTVKPWEELLKRNFREKLYAGVLAACLWVVLVFGAQEGFKDVVVPLKYSLPSNQLKVAQAFPEKVELTLSGTKKELYFARPEDIVVHIDLKLKTGRQIVSLHANNFTVPKGLVVESVQPSEITFIIDQRRGK